MSSLIYCPAALWEMHEAQVIEIAWKEYERGSVVTILKCDRFFSSCPTNLQKDRWRCIDCVNQSNYTMRELLPPSAKIIWLKNSSKNSSAVFSINPDELELRKLGDFYYDGHPFGFSVLSHLITLERDIFPSGLKSRDLANQLLQESIEFYNQSLQVLSCGFDEVFVWGGRRMSEAPLIFAAKKRGVQVKYFELGYRPKTYLLSESGIFTFSGMLIEIQKWVDERKKELPLDTLLSEGMNFFTDWMAGRSDQPHFKWFLQDYNEKPNLKRTSNKKLLLVCTSSLWESFAYQDYKELIVSEFYDPYEVIERICFDEEICNKFDVVVRWHPNLRRAGPNELKRMNEIINKATDVSHVKPEEAINSYDLVKMSDVVVTFGSTIGIESTVLGKPSILLGLSSYMNLGSVYQPSSYQEFRNLISTELSPKITDGAFLWGDWMKNFGTAFEFIKEHDGHFFLQDKKVQQNNARTRVRSKWFALKHQFKKIFALMI
jgi:hypothetical protein